MTPELYFSRVRLKRDASTRALIPLLIAGDSSPHPGHRLVWSLFADDAGRRRDFLWRETERRGAFFVLSRRWPRDAHNLFEIAEPKPFAPDLAPGDRLRFSLRANPVVRRRKPGGKRRSAKHDVVMDALRRADAPTPARAEARFEAMSREGPHNLRASPSVSGRRFEAMSREGLAWLGRQGAAAGFAVAAGEVKIDGYSQHRIPRRGGEPDMRFSTLDFDGLLEVRDPAAFREGVARGFGAAKAFGCGLMLIRRA